MVDYKDDRYIENFRCYSPDKDPTREAISNIVGYLSWMEHKFHYGNAISKLDKVPRDNWYFRRISSLRRLINTLEISTTKIAETMRDRRMANSEGTHGDIDMEGSIVHFLWSWEIYEEKNVDLSVSEVEILVGK